MRIARNEEMGSCGACQGNEVIVAGVWRESGSYVRIGLDRGQAAKQGNVAANLGYSHIRSKFWAQENAFQLGEQCWTSNEFERAFEP